MRISKNFFYVFFSIWLFLFANKPVLAEQDTRFQCGGIVEKEVWNLWDRNIHNYIDTQLLGDRLLKHGDVNALYYFQLYTSNMVSMSQRCKRADRLQEIAKLIRTAYDALEPGTPDSPGRRWVCRGGSICNDKNGLINTEVMLYSVQFLGLASSVANALATLGDPLNDEEINFIRDTVQIIIEHLVRWSDDETISALQKSIKAASKDVKTGSSALFFTDKQLWLITIYAEIAGIFESQGSQISDFVKLPESTKERLNKHLSTLLQLFSARISIQRNPNSRLGNADLADLDRGYWRLYGENRYAGYEESEKPVVCEPSTDGKNKYKMEYHVLPDEVEKRQDIGWDISHARRLVQVLYALERNRDAIKKIFSIVDSEIPPISLSNSFANTLVAVIWDGDISEPLFTNYWCGANGWYRVAYDNGTGQCREGTPPYGLTDSFLTGGYITWERYLLTIGKLGHRFYELMNSSDKKELEFVEKYYPALSKGERDKINNLSIFMFLPSLVGNINK
jgi:hypothetical protein